MIPTIIIVGAAFLWLGFESEWLMIDLMGKSDPMVTIARQMLPAPKVTTHTLETQYSVMVTPVPTIPKLLDTIHFKPSTFQPLDMPKTQGDVTIICRRE